MLDEHHYRDWCGHDVGRFKISPASLSVDLEKKNMLGMLLIISGIFTIMISLYIMGILIYAERAYEVPQVSLSVFIFCGGNTLGLLQLSVGIIERLRKKDWHGNKYGAIRAYLVSLSELEGELSPELLGDDVLKPGKSGLEFVVECADLRHAENVLIAHTKEEKGKVHTTVFSPDTDPAHYGTMTHNALCKRSIFRTKVSEFGIKLPSHESSFDKARHILDLASKVGTKNEVAEAVLHDTD